MVDEFDIEQFDDGSEGFKSLRKALKKYQQENESLREENTSLKQASAKSQLTSAFTKHGIDEKFLALYTDDDKSDEAIARWGELYGFKKAEETPAEESSTVPPEEQQALGAISRVSGGSTNTQASLVDRLKAAKNPAELNAVIASAKG